jgi:hypothetical protein
MRDSLGFSTNIVAFQIFGTGSNVLARFGRPLPTELPWPWPEAFSREAALAGPFRSGDQTFMLASANMFNPTETQVGTLVVLTPRLQRIVEEETGLGRSEVGSRARQHKALPIFFPSARPAWTRPRPRPHRGGDGRTAAGQRAPDGLPAPAMARRGPGPAYGPIKGRNGAWSCAWNARTACINRLLTILGLVRGALVLLGTSAWS